MVYPCCSRLRLSQTAATAPKPSKEREVGALTVTVGLSSTLPPVATHFLQVLLYCPILFAFWLVALLSVFHFVQLVHFLAQQDPPAV